MSLSLQNYFEDFLGVPRSEPVHQVPERRQAPSQSSWKRPQVVEAWCRCGDEHRLARGAALFRPANGHDLAPTKFAALRQHRPYASIPEPQRTTLIELAEAMASALQDVGAAIMLADAEGTLFHVRDVGLPACPESSLVLRIGTVWAERVVGNNGIGTAALLGQPMAFQGEEHYCSELRGFGTAGCPIVAPDGRLLATLGAITDRHEATGPLLALVRLAGHVVEAKLFDGQAASGWLVRLRPADTARDASAEAALFVDAMLVVDQEGCIQAANHAALALLEGERGVEVIGQNFAAVLGVGLYTLIGMIGQGKGRACLRAASGRDLLVEAVVAAGSADDVSIAAKPATASRRWGAACFVGPDAERRTEEVSGDLVLEAMLPKLLQMQERKISMLITGESGVGKNYLVQTLHALGPRKNRPLVIVNTAGLPRELIQSELFGYQPGSFTGAHVKGKTGKVLAANGGVLFLNEIGDMPLELQASLLQLLESSEVIPIGGSAPIPVDIHVVAATNRTLREDVRKGTFRQDLFYRLNGAEVSLPPLRERVDKEQIIRKFLKAEQEIAEDRHEKQLSPEVMQIFLRHPWPGNIRELRNVVRLLLASVSGPNIGLADLPSGFLEEMDKALQSPSGEIAEWHFSGSGEARGRSAERPLAMALWQWELRAVRAALAQSEGNVSEAARILEITRTTLYRKMTQYGLLSVKGRTPASPPRQAGGP